VLLSGFQNIGVVDFRRNLDFRREFQFGVYKKLATFLITTTAAILLRNYWALVIGQVAGACIQVILSYRMSEFRPRLSLARVGEIWGFSRWLVLSRVVMLINRQFDRWVVGSIAGAEVMGSYYVAQDFAASPSEEVVAPMSRAAFPVYSRLRFDPKALADALGQMLSSVAAITFATGLGVAAVANDFVHVVLGAKWDAAIPIMPWLGLFAAVYGIVRTLDMFLIATGGERASALLASGYAVGVIPVLWYAGNAWGPEGIAATKAFTSFGLAFMLAHMVTRIAAIRPGSIWTAVWPPILAALSMFIAVKVMQAQLPVASHLFGLIRDASIGAFVYVSVLVLAWVARGRPPGIEQNIVRQVRRMVFRSRHY